MKERNKAIGHCVCTHKGCELKVEVFKYRPRSADITRRRFGNKLYARCPDHGKFEGQEYLLENIEWASGSAPVDTGAPPEEPPLAPPVKTSVKPVPAPVRPAPAQTAPTPEPIKKKSWLESLEEML